VQHECETVVQGLPSGKGEPASTTPDVRPFGHRRGPPLPATCRTRHRSGHGAAHAPGLPDPTARSVRHAIAAVLPKVPDGSYALVSCPHIGQLRSGPAAGPTVVVTPIVTPRGPESTCELLLLFSPAIAASGVCVGAEAILRTYQLCQTERLMISRGSPVVSARLTCPPLSSRCRQMKPGARSARALMRSRHSANSAIGGEASGNRIRARLTCASCGSAITARVRRPRCRG